MCPTSEPWAACCWAASGGSRIGAKTCNARRDGMSELVQTPAALHEREHTTSAIPSLFWKLTFLALMIAGAWASILRYTRGLGAVTNLSDRFPWGLWVGFDVLCGVGLAAGGFTLVAAVHIFNIKRYRPIVRPAVLTAFLGYLLVTVA